MVHARLEADAGEGLLGSGYAGSSGGSIVDEGQLDIVKGGRAGKQVEGLENEPDFLITDAGELIVVELRDELTVEPVFALRWCVEAADEVHESGCT